MTFVTKCTNIGYTEGVIAVFEANQQKKKAVEFLYFGERNTDGPTYIDEHIAQLQNGVIDFKVLNFIEANPRLLSQELVNVFEQVYPEVEQRIVDQVKDVPSGATENMCPVGTSEASDVGTSRPGDPKVPVTGEEAEEAVKEVPDGDKQVEGDLVDVKGI